MLRSAARILPRLPLALVSPILAFLSWLALSCTDLAWKLFGRRHTPADRSPDTHAATVVIPNWNGRDLLEKYIPSILTALAGHPDNELLVVDNGSTDGSAEFLRQRFPTVKVLALPRNLGFGGGSNAGFRAASNDIVVLLNSDMRVAPDFLQPLLDAFTDELVFAVSCQIFFSDPTRKREETGLTQGWWSHGGLRVRHNDDPAVDELFPCFYGGGGSCAFDRRKFLELGGFDGIFHPFYLEDTDIGYSAWKRGWKVLYQPQSHVWHEHRGTIGKTFSRDYIQSVVARNFLLFAWKNIHTPAWLAGHFAHAWMGAFISLLAGRSPERPTFGSIARATLRLPAAMRARWRARSLACVDDAEAFRRPMGACFRDRFLPLEASAARLSVLFVSPYPIWPPIHGGGVFMSETVQQLGQIVDLHLLVLLDEPRQLAAHEALRQATASMEFHVRPSGKPQPTASVDPHAIREFHDRQTEWLIHRQAYLKRADVVQLEYTQLGQYACPARRMAWTLFEHDIYFQSVRRLMGSLGSLARLKAGVEYLRALRHELKMLPALDEIQTCTLENSRHLLSYLPELDGRLDHDLRAGIDVHAYNFRPAGRTPKTLLFLGGFRHTPNVTALYWFLERVLPHVLQAEPDARLKVVGADPPAPHTLPDCHSAVELIGFAQDIHAYLADCAVFICPIQSGSGVRVKLLEAFASGIPVVSTRVGAEGLATKDGDICALADEPEQFARRILDLFRHPGDAQAMAERARHHVERHHDIRQMTRRLESAYRRTLRRKTPTA
jgi:GT2 family glycosyltransferase